MCWGVDDFDEAYPLPYTNDLVRLAASLKIVIDAGDISLKFKAGCDAILEGYLQSLRDGGQPVVLAEREQKLGKLGVDSFKPPANFWKKLNRLPAIRHNLAKDLKRALEKTLPDELEYKVARREAGLGSLGQERFVAIGKWQGGYVAREAKQMVPSACSWLNGEVMCKGQSWYEKAISSAVRSPDPFQFIEGSWLIRRLSPDSNPIDIQALPKHSDEQMLLSAMGAEAANVHLGTKGIRVNCVGPGPVWTPLQTSGGQPDKKIPAFGSETPMKRPGQPVEMAPLYVLLASQESSYVTGEVYGATGGLEIS